MLRGEQSAASDPRAHVWLSASAGTGKTQVLAARVFRLLLRGVAPSALLCLTFTKAGAAEMAGRINKRLAAWVRMDDISLGQDLIALGEAPSPELRARARTLFAGVLDAPGGGLRIQTIHGFCQSLLATFPVEAGLAPGFRLVEAREEKVLQREALAAMLVAARAEGRDHIITAVGALSRQLGEGEAERFLAECARVPLAMAALPADVRGFIRTALDLPAGEVSEHLAACCGDDAFDLIALKRIAQANRGWATKTGEGRAATIDTWVAATPAERVVLLRDLLGTVRTGTGTPAKQGLDRLVGLDADYEELARALGDCCAGLIGIEARAAYADLLAQALTAGREYSATYEAAKRRAGAVDFNDLIARTIALFDQDRISEWVRFKLDQVTDHVLIDEAQDTNADQWRIVRAVAEEFFAGLGTRDSGVRTLFTVGDRKQAIFGFQGTDPTSFRAAELYFSRLAEGARGDDDTPADERGPPFSTLSLTHSFRSTRPILEFVDAAVAALPLPALGIDTPETHASEVAGPGIVELWPPTEVSGAGDGDDEEGWIDDATRKIAGQVARQVKAWLDGGLMLESKGRPLAPEDVMILVKRRGELASLLVARLYAEGVPVAGVDRLRLNAPLAVQDLLAAVRFALQPDDDLNLASLLVSPLLGWSQEELLAVAAERRGSLWRAVRERATDRVEPLAGMLRRADLVSPHRFLEELLSGPLDGRRKLMLRLGTEARDPIEELLSAALAFESNGSPSLQLFIDWFDRGDVEIVRDASQPHGAVRVMTAHGAKGLQAPLVILADACVDPTRSPRSVLRWQPEGFPAQLPVLRPRKHERSGPIGAIAALAEERDLEEHWRLFYVAATRAEERLVVAGALGPRAKGVPPAQSWYAAAAAAMTTLGVTGEGVRIFAGTNPQPPAKPKPRKDAVTASVAIPDWARRPAPVEARPPRPLAPSSVGEDAVADPPPGPAMRAAAERGRLLHALFERLPAVAVDRRRAAADRWLADSGGVADAAARAEIVDAACAVIDDPRFAEVFGPDALAEAPIAAVVADGVVVAGTADRLLVTPERVQVIDFKTGRTAPAARGDIPVYHLRQMAAYVAALRVIFPDRRVEAALLYAAGPTLFALPDEVLAAHKPGFAATEQSLPSAG